MASSVLQFLRHCLNSGPILEQCIKIWWLWTGTGPVSIIYIPVGIWIASIWVAENIWIANFCLVVIQMVYYSDARYLSTWHMNSRLVFKWWSEYQSVNQMVIRIPNFHGTRHLNTKPFYELTSPFDLNNKFAIQIPTEQTFLSPSKKGQTILMTTLPVVNPLNLEVKY